MVNVMKKLDSDSRIINRSSSISQATYWSNSRIKASLRIQKSSEFSSTQRSFKVETIFGPVETKLVQKVSRKRVTRRYRRTSRCTFNSQTSVKIAMPKRHWWVRFVRHALIESVLNRSKNGTTRWESQMSTSQTSTTRQLLEIHLGVSWRNKLWRMTSISEKRGL